jgi:hypothetical protein
MLGDILRAIKAECNRKDESSMRDAILNAWVCTQAYWLLFVFLIATPALAIWKIVDLATYFLGAW